VAIYCRLCAGRLGHLTDVFIGAPVLSTYQLGKFLKHTAAGGDASVFSSTSTGPYGDYIVSAAASGLVEVDDKGRRNFIFIAGQPTGFDYRNGTLIGPTEAVKVVLSSDDKRVHAFPISVGNLTTRRCSGCGALVSS
jgi:hypothetical protein